MLMVGEVLLYHNKEYYYKGIRLDECVPMHNHAGYFIMYTINGKKWVEIISIVSYIKNVTEIQL